MTLKFEKPTIEETHLKALIYGQSGAGKTTFAVMTAVPGVFQGLKTLVLQTESNGKMSVAYAASRGWTHKDIARVQIDSLGDLKEAYEFLKTNPDAFELVIIDSLDDLQEMMKISLMQRRPNERTLTMQDWQILINDTKTVVRMFRDLPLHVVFISHVKEDHTDETRFLRPLMSGQTTHEAIAGMVNLVGYLFKQTGENGRVIRRVVLDGDERIMSKGHPNLQAMEEPFIPMWLDKIAGRVPREYTISQWIEWKRSQNKTHVSRAGQGTMEGTMIEGDYVTDSEGNIVSFDPSIEAQEKARKAPRKSGKGKDKG